MIYLDNILSEESSFAHVFATSKKRTLEFISEAAAKQVQSLEQADVYQKLLKRERLGTTAIGHGIAIPHCRVDGLDTPLVVLTHLKQGIDFGAIDGEDVDIVIALLVPKEATEEHLQLLAQLAELFSQEELRKQVRDITDNHKLYQTVISWNNHNGL